MPPDPLDQPLADGLGPDAAEAQVDVRGADLIAAGGPIAPPDGRLVTARFRKGT